MWLDGLWFVVGLGALVLGADALVRGASKLALTLGISPLVVGLTIVAFGTSAPELAVSTSAVLGGQTDIAVGNVVGSNIFNVLFILGLSALIVPLVVHQQLIRQEVPIMLGASLLLALLGLDGRIVFWEGGLLFALLCAYTAYLVIQSRRAQAAASPTAFDEAVQPPSAGAWDARPWVQWTLIAVGLALLVWGADRLVGAAVAFARAWGVSDLVIGLTIVAAGTSMPEVATSIAAALKGERDIAVGNVVGSNTFNILGVVGVSGLVSGQAGLTLADSLRHFDMWVMLAVAMACLPIFLTGRSIARWEGGVFLAYYVAYATYLILAAQQHAQLQAFSAVMLGFVLPLTLVTLMVLWLREPGGHA